MRVDALTSHARPSRIARSPALWVADEFLDEREIDDVLALFGDEAFVTAHADHHGVDASGFSAELPARAHPLLAALMRRVERALGLRSCLEPTFRFRYYGEGMGHPPHLDGYTAGGARLAITALITLVGADEGGETRFIAARPEPVSVAGRKGRLLAWTSTLPGGEDDPASAHEGAPVVRGAKGILMAFLYLPPDAHDGELVVVERRDGV